MQFKRKNLAHGACAGILGLAVAAALPAQGQRGYHQIYDFGAVVAPMGLTGTGNTLYGTTQNGGSQGMGSVYALTLPETQGEPWTYTTLYNFGSTPSDGASPYNVSIGGYSNGLPVLYGTTSGGGEYAMGTVFSLVPPQTPGGAWTEHVLHSFQGADGWGPLAPLAADLRNGEPPVLYGTTGQGGASYGVTSPFGAGAVFSLTPPATQGGTWTETVLYSFVPGGTEGQIPNNVVLGSGPGGAPVLYGFARIGGALSGGVVFSLAEENGTWTYNDIYDLSRSDVISSPTGLTLGSNGVLYGTTEPGSAANSGGVVYSLTPPTSAGGSWTENTLYSFGAVVEDGMDPAGVVVGSNGSLYGATSGGGLGYGTVYSLTPPASPGGAWTENVIYRFPFNGEVGGPGGIVIGPHGTLYGMTYFIGGFTIYTVFAIEP
jgi:uncharacterized repeat protein (TIGR03803 family)